MAMDILSHLLAVLTGQLHASGKKDLAALEELQTDIARALIDQDPASIRDQASIFEKSDLFLSRNLNSKSLENAEELLKRVRETRSPGELRVFVRSSPIRSTQLPDSVPSAAAGVRVTTKGPIKDIVIGPPIFIDFVNVKKLITLYVAGQTMPAILFDATFKQRKAVPVNTPPVEITKTYTVIPDTVWISAKLLVPTAAADQYCPLRVKGGTIVLDADPQLVNGKLTIAAATTATCTLQLEQASPTAGDTNDLYGSDARKAEFNLPAEFKFSFKGATKNILAVGFSNWNVYEQVNSFSFAGGQTCVINAALGRLCIPMKSAAPGFAPATATSPFFSLSGATTIKNAWWGLPIATLDIANPLEADGNGALVIECAKGLSANWTNLQGGGVSLSSPFIIGEPGRIGVSDQKSDGLGTTQHFDMWRDERNAFGTSVDWKFTKEGLLIYNTVTAGDEVLVGLADCDIKADRPVKVNGEPVPIRSRSTIFGIAVNKAKKQLMLLDPNMLQDNKKPADKVPKVRPFGLAMHNALFTVTPPNTLLLSGEITDDFTRLKSGKMNLAFGLFFYLPTLPDPYAANLGVLEAQFKGKDPVPGIVAGAVSTRRESTAWMWLVSLVQWEEKTETEDKVGVSFHFAPLQAPLDIEKETRPAPKPQTAPAAQAAPSTTPPPVIGVKSATAAVRKDSVSTIPQKEALAGVERVKKLFTVPKSITDADRAAADKEFKTMAMSTAGAVSVPQNPFAESLQWQDFRLLDVSSKANQMGVAFTHTPSLLQRIANPRQDIRIIDDSNASASGFPIIVNGLDVVTEGRFAQAFTVPQIAWEPVFNLTPKAVPGDPPAGFNFYHNDGVATRIGNLSRQWVPLSPIPMAKYLVQSYREKTDNKTYALFNLPFGMVAITLLDNASAQAKKPDIENISPIFDNYVNGGIQLELTAGTSMAGPEGNLFEGYTVQLFNINNPDGTNANASTLAYSPTVIFNKEFFTNSSNLTGRPGVPLERIGLSGYGASTFSNWTNKEAVFAQTSQALFNVTTGRTSHEVVQVKSMVYPWGIRVVRTITLFRLANGYVMRVDSGWQAESDGKFDFTYHTWENDEKKFHPQPYEIHPGMVRGLYGIRNIREIPKAFVDGTATMQALTFDADVELESVVEGGNGNRVPSKGIAGYVQLAPAGEPISPQQFKALMAFEKNTIGGPINCMIRVAGTNQRMKLNRFDVNNSVTAAHSPAFVAATRGSVVMPKDGSWSMVQHTRGSGEVVPLPEQLSVPLIRLGAWVKDQVVDPADAANQLMRIAFPGDLLKAPDPDTINFGFLQNMGTQKVLYLTPSFKKGVEKLMSKTPPLLADAYRLMNSKGIFPNIGDAESAFGTAIQLLKGVDGAGSAVDVLKKAPAAIKDLGKEVYEVMDILVKEEAGKIVDQGYALLKGGVNNLANKALKFDLPNFEFPLVDITGLKIYVEYKAASKPKGQAAKDYVGKFDFDVESFAADAANTWKGRMNNLAMVVDLGPMERLMTIKGNFNSQKGQETDLGSSNASDNAGLTLPKPEIEFSDAIEPVIQILEILSALSSGEYGEALKKGLKVAMSNSANIWEYKFEATKDIPLVRFPPTDAAYNNPQTPLKLEASLGIGVYFNAALKVTTDPMQLLPTAGAFFKFHGGLQVMCFSVGAGSIYAIGEADLMLKADTSPLISLMMKFGFGVQLAVGLPVIGNVSITFMAGVEIYVDSTQKVIVTAFLLFRGHAEILGGLIGVTITIEARGSIEKGGANQPTNCKAQVTFALDISIFLIIDISFTESWEETRQIA